MSNDEQKGNGGEAPVVEGLAVESGKRSRGRGKLPIVLRDKWGVWALYIMGPSILAGLVGAGLWMEYLNGDAESPLVNILLGTLLLLVPPVLAMIGRLVRHETVVDRDGVTRRWFFRDRPIKTWTEPLDHYEGVQYGFGSLISRDDVKPIHKIMLKHPKERRCVELVSALEPTEHMPEVCEDYARLLGLPVVEQMAGEGFRRELGDLDKTIWKLIAEGKVAIEPVDRASPPWGLKLAVDGDTHVVTRPPGKGWYLGLALAWAPGLGICGLGLISLPLGSGTILLSSFLAVWLGVCLLAFWEELYSFRVEVRPDSIQFGYLSRGVIRKKKEIIETGPIERIDVTPKGVVEFVTVDGRTVRTRPLGKKRGKWLCNYILATGAEWGCGAGTVEST